MVNHSEKLKNITEANTLCNVPPTTLNIIYIACLIVIIVVNLTGNSFVLVVVNFSRTLRRQTTNHFLASLAFTDLLMAVVSMPIKVKQSFHNQLFCMPKEVCWFYFLSDTTFSTASITHLAVIAVDRYIAVRYPYQYCSIMSRTKARTLIAFCWIYSSIWGCLMTIKWDYSVTQVYGIYYSQRDASCYQVNDYYFLTIYIVNFMLPIVIMSFTYRHVYSTAMKHIKAISQNEVRSKENPNHRRRKREFKALRTVLYVFITFLICWLPSISLALSTLFEDGKRFWHNLRMSHRSVFIIIFFVCVQILPPLNSALNPFIYVISNTNYRETFKSTVLRVFKRSSLYPNVRSKRSSEMKSRMQYKPEPVQRIPLQIQSSD